MFSSLEFRLVHRIEPLIAFFALRRRSIALRNARHSVVGVYLVYQFTISRWRTAQNHRLAGRFRELYLQKPPSEGVARGWLAGWLGGGLWVDLLKEKATVFHDPRTNHQAQNARKNSVCIAVTLKFRCRRIDYAQRKRKRRHVDIHDLARQTASSSR